MTSSNTCSIKSMETPVNGTIASDSWIPEYRLLEDSCIPVIIDIETTGLSKYAEIIQIAAKCGIKSFEVHILPQITINTKASQVTGFTSNDTHLFYLGQAVKTYPSEVAARQFVDFLLELNAQILLVGHNILRFDAPLIFQWLDKHDLLKECCSLVYGMTDTIPLLRRDNIGKQEELAKKYLVGPEWDDIRKKAHNATIDCILLDGLLEYFKINNEVLKSKSLSLTDFFKHQSMEKNQRKNMPLISELKPILSQVMLRRVARHGITIDKLKTEYLKYGNERIKALLGLKVNGKPRVTANKRVIQNVVDFIKKLIDSEKEIPKASFPSEIKE